MQKSKNKTIKHLEKKLLHKVGKAIGNYGLIDDNDRILIAFSGGKDSWTLLHILSILQKKAPVRFSLSAVLIDQGFSPFDEQPVLEYMHTAFPEVPADIYHADIPRLLNEHGNGTSTPCSFCSRLRRGILYRLAQTYTCNKIALAHHADDFIETLMLNIFFAGSVKAMAPLLRADDGVNTVIRPLCYTEEKFTKQFSQYMGFPIIKSGCPMDNNKKAHRIQIKKLLADLEASHPGIKRSLLASLSHVESRHLMDQRFLNNKITDPESLCDTEPD